MPSESDQVSKTSGMAITSLVLGLLSFFLWVFAGIPAILTGIIALGKISGSERRLRGTGLAITGICTGLIGVLLCPALLLPAVQAAREAARRNESMNQLKEISLGILNYESDKGVIPAAGTDRNGVGPELSWRVHLLPYIGEEALYRQFRLDEPWDSPHNRALIPQMPQIYQSPNMRSGTGLTNYLAATGPETAFPGGRTGLSFRDFSDGFSDTILVVEADEDQAVEWTRPADWVYDPSNPRRGLGGLRPLGFLAAFADASARWIASSEIDDATLKTLFTRAARD